MDGASRHQASGVRRRAGALELPTPGDVGGLTADRAVFALLRACYRGRRTGVPTAFYPIRAVDTLHPYRLQHAAAAYDLAGLG